jgi:hypothetical protein
MDVSWQNSQEIARVVNTHVPILVSKRKKGNFSIAKIKLAKFMANLEASKDELELSV